MPRSLPLLALAAAGAAAFPAAAAAAPTLTADRACYTPGQPIVLTGAGYTPAGPIRFLAAFAAVAGGDAGASAVPIGTPVAADAAGGLSARIAAPDLSSDDDIREALTITANDQARQAAQPPLPPAEAVATVQVRLSAWAVGVRAWAGGRGDPRASSDFVGIGWEPFRRIWAHYVFAGTRVRSVRIGAVSGACGDLAKRIRQFPFRPVRAGSWTVYFSPDQEFDRGGAWIRYRVVVPKSSAVPAAR
jgi:hypothetical protein